MKASTGWIELKLVAEAAANVGLSRLSVSTPRVLPTMLAETDQCSWRSVETSAHHRRNLPGKLKGGTTWLVRRVSKRPKESQQPLASRCILGLNGLR